MMELELFRGENQQEKQHFGYILQAVKSLKVTTKMAETISAGH
jgi:hypothetical protein